MFRKTPSKPIEDQLRKLEHRLEDLERSFKGLDLEWTETYDKLRKLHSRLAKRDQRAQEDAGDTNGKREGVGPPPLNPLAQRLLGLKEG